MKGRTKMKKQGVKKIRKKEREQNNRSTIGRVHTEFTDNCTLHAGLVGWTCLELIHEWTWIGIAI